MHRSRGFVLAPALVVAGAVLSAGCGHQKSASLPSNDDWPSYNRDLQSDRFSPLDDITPANAPALKRVCSVKMPEGGSFQTGPIEVAGTLYVTTLHDTLAINAVNCVVIWQNSYTPQAREIYNSNRGVALDDGLLFRGYQDGHLAAIGAQDGKSIWNVTVGEGAKAQFLSAAPIVWHGMVFEGIAGADWGSRGRMMAFEEKTGKELWRFDLIPEGSEAGADTWDRAKTAAHGGGSTWTSYSVDQSNGLVYVPVGNPAPDFSSGERPGANLYTDSIVALDASNGRLAWYHQFVPHDSHDYDMAAAPAIVTTRAGKELMIAAGKNAMLYAVDLNTHAIVYSLPVSEISNTNVLPTAAGVHTCPGWIGGVEWNGPAYDPETNAIYVNSVHLCGLYKRGETPYSSGAPFFGGEFVPDPSSAWYGWVTAIDADTGKVIWRYRSSSPMISGVTPTKGGVVFTGDLDGNLLAFEASSGKKLVAIPTGGAIAGGVVTYRVGDTQYVASTSGNVSRLTWGALGTPAIYIFSTQSSTAAAASAAPAQSMAAAGAPAVSGATLYTTECASCHQANGKGVPGTFPPLASNPVVAGNVKNVIHIVKYGLSGKIQVGGSTFNGMMPAWGSQLSDTDIAAVVTYVRSSWGNEAGAVTGQDVTAVTK